MLVARKSGGGGSRGAQHQSPHSGCRLHRPDPGGHGSFRPSDPGATVPNPVGPGTATGANTAAGVAHARRQKGCAGIVPNKFSLLRCLDGLRVADASEHQANTVYSNQRELHQCGELSSPARYTLRLVAHTGFEPVISSLRGRCPRPLDECATVRRGHCYLTGSRRWGQYPDCGAGKGIRGSTHPAPRHSQQTETPCAVVTVHSATGLEPSIPGIAP